MNKNNVLDSIANILIIDDMPENIKFLISILSQNNYNIKIATSGKSAFEELKAFNPDLILLDIVMPEMDGFEVCKLLKADENLKNIPVIFITSNDDINDIIRAFELGAQDYITKPFNPQVVMARVYTHIKLKHQTDSLIEAYKELDQFSYTVSHDLKVPLNSIIKFTEFFYKDYYNIIDNNGKRLLDLISQKAKNTIALINSLLELSKMTRLKPKNEIVDLKNLFNDVYEEIAQLESSERKIIFNLGNLPVIVGDQLLLRELATNIISNAIKFTRKQKETIINVNSFETEEEYIISIEDNGVGFDMKYAGKLFNVFERLHTQNEFEGTGAGLAICKRILKKHNGNAWIVSEPGKGTLFIFSLPKINNISSLDSHS